MRLLPGGVCWGDAGPWLAQPKPQLPEQTLALPRPKANPILPGDPGCQCFAIPQIPPQPHISRHPAKSNIDAPEVLLVEAPGTAGPLTFTQPGQATFFEVAHPILD